MVAQSGQGGPRRVGLAPSRLPCRSSAAYIVFISILPSARLRPSPMSDGRPMFLGVYLVLTQPAITHAPGLRGKATWRQPQQPGGRVYAPLDCSKTRELSKQ